MTLRALYDLPAPAKVNLFLHVLGRRDDGYHLLQSVFMLIDWCDTLSFELRTDGSLSRQDLTAELPADDLSLRAARLLQQRSGTSLGAHIAVDKQVPWGAGLGGGSSDAATTLIALNRLWGLGWTRDALMALGLELGADVPFFIGGRNAWVEGIGERLTPIDLPAMTLAVVKPPMSLPTPLIFSSPLLVRDTPAATLAGFVAEGSGGSTAGESRAGGSGAGSSGAGSIEAANAEASTERMTRWGRNDLQAAAESLCPQIVEASSWLESQFGNSRMTGSGSAVFAHVDTSGAVARDASKAIMPPSFAASGAGRMCKGLAVHPLVHWLGQ
ncbi:MAG: 4-diphosphocytidyl-2-C-methyl-D-erythritol kinase [Rhizobacter sp.]|nr:4-diphosphocytidyl-2-C-methyl-D-erythritol kinase [Rhizobacter sp.]